MATGFLILHGVENHRPPEHWQFLLAAQLVEHGSPAPDVQAPSLLDVAQGIVNNVGKREQ
jgi:hypothetical protein